MYSKDIRTNHVMTLIKDYLPMIDQFIDEAMTRNYMEFKTDKEILEFFSTYLDALYKQLSFADMENIRYYTGFNYRDINAVFRNNWNYEINGHISRKAEFYQVANDIARTLAKVPKIPGNIITYRGVDLEPFKSFGINSVTELTNMTGKYMFEAGLTSTSLIKDTSYYQKDLEYHSQCNILIEYYVPEECSDGIPLLTNDLSYSTGQNEFLFNASSLVKVIDVDISSDKKNATLKVVYIPVGIWSPTKKIQNEEIQR